MVRYISPLPVKDATGDVSHLYKQMKRDFGLVGDVFHIHSLTPSLLYGMWASFRETEIVGSVSRSIKEAVALAVSKTNQCPFCIDAHSTILLATGDKQIAQYINQDQADEIPDRKMREIISWALATLSPGTPIIESPPFAGEEAPEFIGTVVINHYINRLTDIFIPNKSILPIQNSLLKKILNLFIPLFFSSSIKKSRAVGDSLSFISQQHLPADLEWARPNKIICQAFASFAVATEESVKHILSDNSRIAVEAYLHAWEGEKPSIGRGWERKQLNLF
jgi:AhpD family alkylhydroperoxidase